MNLVFQAEGLSVGEGAFLLACCNHTDAKGYVIASMQQLADEAHMKMTAAKANKQRLIQRGLLASKERYSPKNRARIADLYRVNLELLASMKRARTDYGPTLVEELTFAAPQETPSSDPPSESDPTPRRNPTPPRRNPTPPPSESDGTGGADSDPLLPPSSSPSSLPPVTADAEGASGTATDGGEREAAAPEATGADAVVDAYVQALGRPLLNGSRERLRAQAEQLLAAGYPVGWLAERAAEMPANGWRDLVQHAEKTRVPIPGQAGPAAGDGERCPEHPRRYRVGCIDCAMAVPG
ncbi:hypothetical protein [Streptomyces sp. TRM68367]|uniref:hypothetical protein n=1 Tax=Streptomyces sp. TRM68367 TaxID=2758415 RepID=UPI00165C62B2|nr:hypothetical protein [Streptomyces sp. TRM68367]MBC9730234.1 hypothetical protein [Streptomyces sp. TRM68367]